MAKKKLTAKKTVRVQRAIDAAKKAAQTRKPVKDGPASPRERVAAYRVRQRMAGNVPVTVHLKKTDVKKLDRLCAQENITRAGFIQGVLNDL